MPYFIDLDQQQIVVLPPGREGGPRLALIDTELATQLQLTHGQPLTAEQVSALNAGNAVLYWAATNTTGARPTTVSMPDGSQRSDPRSLITQRAFAVANVVEVVGWALLIISVLAGLLIATSSRTDPFNGSTDHPNVGIGVLTMLVGPIQALMIVMVATYIKSRTERPTP